MLVFLFYKGNNFEGSFMVKYLEFFIDKPLLLFAFLPLVFIILLFKYNRMKQVIPYFKDLKKQDYENIFFTWFLKTLFFLLFLSFAILSLLDLIKENEAIPNENTELDIVFLVDVSNSMLAQDITPNRLTKAKQVIKVLLNELKGARFSLLSFKGEANILVPITNDVSRIEQYIQHLSPNISTSYGSNMEKGIKLAIDIFKNSKNSNKLIILLSDGDELEGDLKNLKQEIKEKYISFISVGLGTLQGSRIPFNNTFLSYNGKEVISKLKPEAMKDLSSVNNGKYFDANDLELFGKLLSFISSYKKDLLKGFFLEEKSKYQTLLFFSVLFLFIYILLGALL